MLDIASTRMLGQVGFLAKVSIYISAHYVAEVSETHFLGKPHSFGQVFSIFEDLEISVDVVATSEVSLSLTLDPSKLWSRELIQQASSCSIPNTLFSNPYKLCFSQRSFLSVFSLVTGA